MNRRALVLTVLLIAISLAFTGTLVTAQMPNVPDMGKAVPNANPSNLGNLLNINSASKEQLSSLPGIGSKYSDKIIAGRPYSEKIDLVTKKIIPQSTYDKVKNLITVGK